MEWLLYLSEIGHSSLTYFWLPLGVWTIASIPLFFVSRTLGRYQPVVRYHGCMALMFALPVGFILMPLADTVLSPFSVTATFPSLMNANSLDFHVNQLGKAASSIPSINEQPDYQLIGFAILGTLSLLLLIFCLFRLAILLYRTVRLQRLRYTLTPVRHPKPHSILEELTSSLGIKRPITLMYGPIEISPMTFGWWNPVIAIPEMMTKEESVLRTALLHEAIHVKRNDYSLGLVTKAIVALFAFHPGIVFLGRQLRLYREASCDVDTLKNVTMTPSEYARLLLRFNTHAGYFPATPMVQQTSTLKQRIEIMSHHQSHKTLYSRRNSVVYFILLLLLPALLVACSTNENHTLAGTNEVIQLEAQVAYLRAEIDSITEKLKTKIPKSMTDEQQAQIIREYEYSAARQRLLREMLTAQMQQLEVARMEAATSSWVQQVQ